MTYSEREREFTFANDVNMNSKQLTVPQSLSSEFSWENHTISSLT